jgi:hypothetical protein
MKEDISSSIDTEQVKQTSIDYFANLRQELRRLKKDLKISDHEISQGFSLSRQVVNQFMRWEGSEDSTARQTLPISRQDLISLWEHVTSEGQIRETKTEIAKENRRKLRLQTAHNLLEMSGFLGLERPQSVVGNDLSKLEKFDRIIFRLSNKTLTSSDLWKIEETVINQLAQLTSNSQEEDKKKDSKKNLDDIKKWLEARYDNIETPWRAVESTLQKYQDSGRKEFKEAEILELFQNVVENQRIRIDSSQKIRVTNCEIKTINFVHTRLSHLKYSSESPVLEEVLREGILIERILRGVKYETKEDEPSFNFMNQIKLTCRLGNNDKEITWFYRSCSSNIDNMISAIKQGIGHDLELKDLSSHVLAEGSDSIVRVSAILKNDDGDYYTGRWVDIDTILSFAQAIIIAAENWVKYKVATGDERERYEKTCYRFAQILNNVDVLMAKTYEYGLSYLDESNQENEDNIIYTIKQLNDQILAIEEMLSEIDEYSSRIYSDYTKVLKEIKYQVKLAESRFYHVVGDVVKAGEIIKGIENDREIDLTEKPFDISNILLKSADMTQKFYTSDNDFFQGKLWVEYLKIIETEIKHYLTRGKGVKSLTDSLYRALAELYGNVGRFEFYNCEPYKVNSSRLENALVLSKRAVYFAMKTDDEKRASHWLARCGRILCRLDRSEDASEYLNASARILRRSATLQYQYQERTDALMLEVNIARGEQCLLEDKLKESIGFFVDAFLGAIHLRFARIMAGSLYGLYRASRSTDQSKGLDIAEILEEFDSDLDKNNQSRKEYIIKNHEKLQKEVEYLKKKGDELKHESERTVEEEENERRLKNSELFCESIEILKKAVNGDSFPADENLPSKLKKQSMMIWNSWVPTSDGDLEPQHHISLHMFDNKFLGVIK